MKKQVALLLLLAVVSATAAGSPCKPLRKTGSATTNIDVLLVGGESYDDTDVMLDDFRYFVDTENRGLFDVYPMNVSVNRFNIWYVSGRDGSSTTSGDIGPFREARYWLKNCPTMEYAAFLAKTSHSWTGGTKDVLRVDGVAAKVDRGNGAVGLIHEWGHLFGNLADEYNYGEGKRPSTRPNCARNRSQAERWWGDIATLRDDVGYERGCKGSENIEPHLGGTIMGDGGLWHYGPVSDRQILQIIADETSPITDIILDGYSTTDSSLQIHVSWKNASNVVEIAINDTIRTKIFAHGSGSRTVTIESPASDGYRIEADTKRDIQEVSDTNNFLWVAEDGEDPDTGTAFTISLNAGWNMVSIPAFTDDRTAVAGRAITDDCAIESTTRGKLAYHYPADDGEGYLQTDTLHSNHGYWIKAQSDCRAQIELAEMHSSTTGQVLRPGWNMISPKTATTFTAIKGGCTKTSPIYHYQPAEGRYQTLSATATLDPANGYWVEIDESCDLAFQTPPKGPSNR